MSKLDLTCGTERRPDSDVGVVSASERSMAELTRTIAVACTARGTMRLSRDEALA